MLHDLAIEPRMSEVIIHLLRSVLYRDHKPELWNNLLLGQASIGQYLRIIGLELYVDESEGHAFLRQIDFSEADTQPLSKLIPKRSLSYTQSILCVLLRKRLLEADFSGESSRVIVSREEVLSDAQVFFPALKDETKVAKRIDAAINSLVKFGFLRELSGPPNRFEVLSVLKAFFTPATLDEIDSRLEEYRDGNATT